MDIVRSTAILLVLVAHAGAYLGDSARYLPDFIEIFGFYGVELFFVLSGFLIGQIILASNCYRSMPAITRFYYRRWLRTLPAYYLVLTLANISAPDFHWKHYLFIQNFDAGEIDFFGVSWSLSIEEWFYLLLPVYLWFFLKVKNIRGGALTPLVAGILAIAVIRVAYVSVAEPGFDFGIRKFVPVRLDALLIGVLLAHVKLTYRSLYEKLCKPGFPLLSFGVLALLPHVLQDANQGLVDKFIWPVVSLGMAVFIPYFETSVFINSLLPRNIVIEQTFSKISLYSYSLYLVHLELYKVIFERYKLEQNAVTLLAATILIITVSAGLYHFFEKPILDFRDRRFVRKETFCTTSYGSLPER